MNRLRLLALGGLLAACATLPPPPAPLPVASLPSTAHLARVDWDAVGAQAFTNLATYLRAPSINPPGDEKLAADVLAALLAEDGIDSEIDVFDPSQPNRANLYARLKGDGTGGGPICLVSHLDVVTAEPVRWPADKGPFSGAIAPDDRGEPTVWGRGALDMKVLGLLQVEMMRLIKREKVPLTRDVILMAVADEEVSGLGMRHVVDKRWDDFKCTHAINEGGLGLHDTLFPGQTTFAISVGERGVLWLKMKASGPPGHGSTPAPGRAPERLMLALDRLRAREVKPRLHPAIYELLASAGRAEGGLNGFVLQRPALVDALVIDRLMKTPQAAAIVTDTVNITGFFGALQPNVVPSEVGVQIDARLLPGTTPAALLAELHALTEGLEGISFEVLDQRPAAASTWDDPLFAALARHAPDIVDEGRRVAVGPVISPGFTDSIFLREKGVLAYGYVPVAISLEEAGTMHGDGERVSKKNVTRGLRALARSIVDVSAAPR